MIGAAERRKLVSILGLLSSDFDGERAAAASAATRLIRAAGVSWDELLVGSEAPRPSVGQDVHPRATRSRSHRIPMMLEHRRALAVCQHLLGHMTKWEITFVASIVPRLTLTPKQADTLLRIAAELRERATK